MTDPEISEEAPQGHRQALVQGSKFTSEKNDWQAPMFADTEHDLTGLSEQNIGVPIAKYRRRSSWIGIDWSADPPEKFLSTTKNDHVAVRAR